MFEWLYRRLTASSLPDLSAARIVDVRGSEEYQLSHIDGALSLPLDQILSQATAYLPQR